MAGGGLIGALRVTLGLDTAQFEAGSKKAQGQAQSLSTRLTSALQAPRASVDGLTGAIGTLATALALREFAGAAKRAFDFADAIADLADRTGASTKLIQELRYAAQLSGSDVATADMAMEKFAKTLGLAQSGSDAQVKMFRALGVTSRDFDTAFRQTLDGLAKLPSIQERNATALQIFGKSAGTLVGLMGQGTKGFDQLSTAARNLGVVLDEDVIRNAGVANDKLDQLKMVMDAQFANAIAKHADEFVALADGLAKAGAAAVEFIAKYGPALTMLGGVAMGGRVAGVPGAIVGGLIGAAGGASMAQSIQDGNMDLAFRKQKNAEALARYRAAKVGAGTAREGVLPDMTAASGELAKQNRLLAAAIAQKNGSPAQPRAVTAGDLPTTGNAEAASAASKAAAEAKRAAAEAARRAKERERNRERFEDELTSMTERQFGLESDLTSSVQEQADLANRRIDIEQEQYTKEIERRVKSGELTAAEGKRLQLAQAFNAGLERDAIRQKLEDDLARQELDKRDAALTLQSDLLRGELEGARTQAERRRLQLQLLDIEYDRQRAALEAVLALNSSTDAEKAISKARLGQLDALKGQAAAGVERQTMGPLAEYLDKIPKTAGEMNEAFQKIAADGLQSMNDGLVDAIMNSKSLADVFKNVANQIVADLLRIAIQKTITNSLGNALGGLMGKSGGDSWYNPGGESGGSGGSFFSKIFGASGSSVGTGAGPQGTFEPSTSSIPGLATGGAFDIRSGAGGIDRNVLSLNGVPKVRVDYGERVTVTPANDAGPAGKSITFDMRGAVVTEDLLRQMDTIASDRAATIVGASGRRMAMRSRASLRG